MNLSDLLVTYKQVKVPEEAKTKVVEIPNPIQSKFDRFISYIENKDKKEKDKDTTKTPEKEDPNAYREFDGRIYGNVDQSTDITETNLSRNDDTADENLSLTDDTVNEDRDNVEVDRPNILSLEQLLEKHREASSIETKTAKQRVQNAQFANNGNDYNKFKQDLQTFYNTKEGKKYNPDNASNDLEKKNLKTIENWLINIAGIETNYQNIPCTDPNSSAYGYFQINKAAARDAGVNHEKMKTDINLQFKIAFKNILKLYNQLDDWVNTNNNTKAIARQLGNDKFTLMYGMWWRPASVKAYLGLYGDNETNKQHLYYESGGMNIFKILARARESWTQN